MKETYVFVYSTYTIMCYVLAVGLNGYKPNGKRNETLLVSLMLIGALIAAVRPENTQDTRIYNDIYQYSIIYLENISIFDIQVFFANRMYGGIELFYILIMSCFRKIFDSPLVFYFVQGFLSNVLMVKGLCLLCENSVDKKTEETDGVNSSNSLIIYALYQIFCGVLYTSSAIRDGLSISIGLFAVANLLLGRKRVLSYILLIISVLIHTTSIIFLPIYLVLLIWKHDIRNGIVLLASFIVPVLYFLGVGALLVGGVVLIFETALGLLNIKYFLGYLGNLNYQLPYREGFIVLLTSVILAIMSVSGRLFVKKTASYIVLAILGLLLMVFAYPIPAVVRFVYIFVLFLVPVVAKMRFNTTAVYMIWALFFIPQFIYVFGHSFVTIH